MNFLATPLVGTAAKISNRSSSDDKDRSARCELRAGAKSDVYECLDDDELSCARLQLEPEQNRTQTMRVLSHLYL